MCGLQKVLPWKPTHHPKRLWCCFVKLHHNLLLISWFTNQPLTLNLTYNIVLWNIPEHILLFHDLKFSLLKEEIMFILQSFYSCILQTFLFCSISVLISLFAGFIDFIVEPTFSGLIDTTEKVIGPLIEEERKARETGNRRNR